MSNIIKATLSLKDHIISDKDTKEGDKTVYKSVFKGKIGNVDLSLSLKSESEMALTHIAKPERHQKIEIIIKDDGQTTLETEDREEQEDKDEKLIKEIKDVKTKETVIINPKKNQNKDRSISPKQLPAGKDSNILDEIHV
jgi:hypothetical protein